MLKHSEVQQNARSKMKSRIAKKTVRKSGDNYENAGKKARQGKDREIERAGEREKQKAHENRTIAYK